MSKYGIFHVGGNPKEIAFLANELRSRIEDLQNFGWEIEGVDPITNTRVWDMSKQMYVTTSEYIIRAKKEDIFAEELLEVAKRRGPKTAKELGYKEK